jgi:hypothetical protein
MAAQFSTIFCSGRGSLRAYFFTTSATASLKLFGSRPRGLASLAGKERKAFSSFWTDRLYSINHHS